MEKFNRQEQLKQLHAERKVKTEKKVDKAINDLVQKNKEINFNGKDALISSLKRKVNSLEKEKKMLKEEISVLYSRLYEDI